MSSSHQFSGDMLVFREVYNCLELFPRQNHPNNVTSKKWMKMMKFTSLYLFFVMLCGFNLIHYFSLLNLPSFIQNTPTIPPATCHPVDRPPIPPRRGELLKNPSPANIPIDPLAPTMSPVCHGRSMGRSFCSMSFFLGGNSLLERPWICQPTCGNYHHFTT